MGRATKGSEIERSVSKSRSVGSSVFNDDRSDSRKRKIRPMYLHKREGQEKEASEKVATAKNGIRFKCFLAWHTCPFAEAERTDTTAWKTKLVRLKFGKRRHGQRQSFALFESRATKSDRSNGCGYVFMSIASAFSCSNALRLSLVFCSYIIRWVLERRTVSAASPRTTMS